MSSKVSKTSKHKSCKISGDGKRCVIIMQGQSVSRYSKIYTNILDIKPGINAELFEVTNFANDTVILKTHLIEELLVTTL